MFTSRLFEAPSIDRVGGKAAGLARAVRLGFLVPETVVIERSALSQVIAREELGSELQRYLEALTSGTGAELAERHRRLAGRLHAAVLPEDLRHEVVGAASELLARAPSGLAVRSSAVYEDSEQASFAGVFESFIGVSEPEAVLARVLDVWSSSWSPRALRYLRRMGIAPQFDGMAVILQPVVPAEAAGVIHTADAATGNPWHFRLHAARGLAVDLLSGTGGGDSLRLEWDSGAILEREVQGELAVLTDEEAAAVASVARRLDQAFCQRLDVEWVSTPEGVWVIQARPLTALPPFFPAELPVADRQKCWERAMFVLPLRGDQPHSFLTPLYRDLSESELWYRHQPEDIVLTGIWREERDLSGFRYAVAGERPSFLDHFSSPSEYEAWLERNEPRYRVRWERRRDELAELIATAQSAIRDSQCATELIPPLFSVRDRFWDLNAFGWSGPQALGFMCEALLVHTGRRYDSEFRSASVLGGGVHSHTFVVALALQELGRTIDEQAVCDAFLRQGLGEILGHLLETEPECVFLARYEALCWELGKTPPSWRERPPFWRTYFDEGDAATMHAIRCAMKGESRDVVEVQRKARTEQQRGVERIRESISRQAPDLLARFDRMLEWARYWTQALNDRHGLAAGLLWERELIWQLGHRLRSEGLIEAPEDVLVLRREDLEALADARHQAAFGKIYRARRHEVERNLRLQPPPVIGVGLAPARVHAAASAKHARGGDAATLHGTGFAGGEASGRARRVSALSPELLDSLDADDILVLPHADAFAYADWHSLLTVVKAVVAPGRPAHHLIQVARECGVPVVALLPGALERIAEGARLSVDGRSGSVTML